MIRVLLDTNFLLLPGQFKVDIFTELERIMQEPFEIAVLESSIEELENLTKKGKSEDRRAAKLGLDLLKHKALKILPSSKQRCVDDLLVEMAGPALIVATQDAELRKRLKRKGAGVIGLRQKNHLYKVNETCII